MLGKRLEMKGRFPWTRRRAVAFLALVCAAMLELLYGCAGEHGVEAFVDENVGEVQEGLTCDFANCVAPDPCHTPAASCNGSGQCQYVPVSDGTACATGKVCASGACISDCFIGNQLYTAGTVNPTNACQVCTPASATTSWTSVADGTGCGTGKVCVTGACVADCIIGGTAYTAGTVNPGNACQVCTPSSSTSAWSNVADGTSCGASVVCGGGSCVSDCFIAGTLYPAGTANPGNACQICTPASSTTGWTNAGDGVKCGTGQICSGSSCVSQCYIGGTFYASGAVNPGNVCQVCAPATSTSAWSTAPDGTSCAANKVCAAGSCASDCIIAGKLYAAGDPNPGNACQVCTPSSSTTAWSNVTDGASCAANKVCASGSCASDCFIAGTLYTSGAPNPNNACQVCTPASATTAWSSAATGTSCGAGLVCAGGSCVSDCFIAGTLYSAGTVNPNNACQACLPGSSTTSWSNKADGTSCSDNNACTQVDTCQGGVCTGGTPLVCSALDQCHVAGTCNQANGVCSNPSKPDGTPCDDGNPTTTNDKCQGGLCSGVNLCLGVTCTALDQCHAVGTCAPATGMCSNPNKPDGTTCDDGNAATVNDVCKGGVCAGVNLCANVTCTALDQCHDVGTCDHATGICSNPNKPNGTPCSDGNACTQGDTCQAGACNSGSPVVCAPLDQCHMAGTCDQATGLCDHPNKPDGATCDDGNAATANDTCAGGLCGGVDLCIGVTCTTPSQCYALGTCAPATGVCTNPYKADNTPCDDGDPNTVDDSCQVGMCTGVDKCASVTCTAEDQCHDVGICDHATGTCSNPAKSDGTPCDDGDAGTTNDKCMAGVCGGENLCAGVTCSAIDACHDVGNCDPSTGACSNPVKADGATCEGGSCKSGVCVPTTDGGDLCSGVTCDAADACHEAGTCDPSTGHCSSPVKADGTTCGEGTCQKGKCTQPEPSNYYACAAAPGRSAPAVAGLLGIAAALAAARWRRRARR